MRAAQERTAETEAVQERRGVGEMFGEWALVERSPRGSSARVPAGQSGQVHRRRCRRRRRLGRRAAAAAVSQDCDDDFGERIWELIWGTDFPESVPQISAANPALKAICSWPSAGCSRHARDVQAQFARTGFSPPLLPTTFLWLELDILNPGRRWSA